MAEPLDDGGSTRAAEITLARDLAEKLDDEWTEAGYHGVVPIEPDLKVRVLLDAVHRFNAGHTRHVIVRIDWDKGSFRFESE